MIKPRLTKKVISILIAILLMTNLIAVASVVPAFAAPADLELEWVVSSQTIQPGGEAEVTISLKNYDNEAIEGILGLQVDVDIDSDYLTYVPSSAASLATKETGDFAGAVYNETNGKVIFMYNSLNDEETALDKTTTKLFKFKVKANSDIAADTEVALPISQFAVVDKDGNRIIAVSGAPSLTISVSNPGTTEPGTEEPTTGTPGGQSTTAPSPAPNDGKNPNTGNNVVLPLGIVLLAGAAVLLTSLRKKRTA